MSVNKGFAMSLVVRRAFALLLLAGAVGASLALPAIFDGSQLANRGLLPTATNPATTRIQAVFPESGKAPQAAAAPQLALLTTPSIAQSVALVAGPRVQVVHASPAAAVTSPSPA